MDPLFSEDNLDTEQELHDFGVDKLFSPIEPEADVFSFHVAGMSGRFFYGDDSKWHVLSNSNVKVVLDISQDTNFISPFIPQSEGNPHDFEHVIAGFRLIDDKGTIYVFGYDTSAVEYTLPFFEQIAFSQQFVETNWTASAWHLTRVIDYAGNMLFDYDYSRGWFIGNFNNSSSSFREYCRVPQENCSEWTFSSGRTVAGGMNGSLISPVYIDSIRSNSGYKIEFYHEDSDEMHPPWIGSAQYSELIDRICDACGGPCNCVYPLPFLQDDKFDSYSYDPSGAFANPMLGLKWKKFTGAKKYFNGNLLRDIRFHYNTDDINQQNERRCLDSIVIGSADSTNLSEKLCFRFFYTSSNLLPAYFDKGQDHWGHYNGLSDYLEPSGSSIDYTQFNADHYASRESNPGTIHYGSLKEIQFPTGGSTKFHYELHDYSQVLSYDHQQLSDDVGDIGGLRIRRIELYDGLSSEPTSTKRYRYVQNFEVGGTISSGILSLKPRYAIDPWVARTDDCTDSGGYRRGEFSLNMLNPLGNLFESPIAYTEVVELRDDSSFTIYEYSSHEDIKDDPPISRVTLTDSPYDRFSDHSFLRGRLLRSAQYNSDKELVLTKRNFWKNLSLLKNSAEYGLSTNIAAGVPCAGNNQNIYTVGSLYKLFYYKDYIVKNKVVHEYTDGKFAVTQNMIYLDTVVDHHTYVFLSEASMTNSNDEIHSTEFQYPLNFVADVSVEDEAIPSLLNMHRFDIKMRTTKRVNGDIVDGVKVIFDDPASDPPMPVREERFEVTWKDGVIESKWMLQKEIIDYDFTILKPTSYRNFGWQTTDLNWTGTGKLSSWSYLDYEQSFDYSTIHDKLISQISVDGTSSTFTYDGLQRLKTTTEDCQNIVTTYDYHFIGNPLNGIGGSADKSFIKTFVDFPLSPGSALTSLTDYQYLDGLGRPIATVRKKQGPDKQRDIIHSIRYDQMQREWKVYEPMLIPDKSNEGKFVDNSAFDEYTETQYYPDPLDRLKSITAPKWYPSTYNYDDGSLAMSSIIDVPSGYTYHDSTLVCSAFTDPDGYVTITCTDRLGNTILSEFTGDSMTVARTLYSYDQKNRLIHVTPPGASSTTDKLLFNYGYYGDDLLRSKKVPDKQEEEYFYSARDLLSAYQDGNMSDDTKWLSTVYDAYGRPVSTGFSTSVPPAHNSYTNLTIGDTLSAYSYGVSGIDLDKLTSATEYLLSADGDSRSSYSYDACGRIAIENTSIRIDSVAYSISDTLTYDRMHTILKTTRGLRRGTKAWQYTLRTTTDHLGRPYCEYIDLPVLDEMELSARTYDEKDQLHSLSLGKVSGQNYLQQLDYTYKANGFLTDINQVDLDDDLFHLSLLYDEIYDFPSVGSSGLSLPPFKNGNITAQVWRTKDRLQGGDANVSVYEYEYDELSRLKKACYSEVDESGTAGAAQVELNKYLSEYTYDLRGNIQSLKRDGVYIDESGSANQGEIDDLAYGYISNSNRLLSVSDNAPALTRQGGFKDRGSIYLHDKNGNMVRDPDGDLRIYYNHLNLPDSIVKGDTTSVHYLYASDGMLVSRKVYSLGELRQERDYIFGTEFEQGDLNLIHHSEGFISKSTVCDTLSDLNLSGNEPIDRRYQARSISTTMTIDPADSIDNIAMDSICLLPGFEVPFASVYLAAIDTIDCDSILGWQIFYTIRDHLGSTRIVFSDVDQDGAIDPLEEILQEHHYYAFGMELESTETDAAEDYYKYGYNGKESQEDVDISLLSYGARFYDPSIGRFTSVDPMAEAIPEWSPYHYTFNNPISFNDPTGMMGENAIATTVVNKDDPTQTYNIDDGYDFVWEVSGDDFNRIKENGGIPDDLRSAWNAEFWRQVGEEMKNANGDTWLDQLLQFFFYDDIGDGIESAANQEYASAVLVVFIGKLKKGKKGFKLVKKLFNGKRMPTPDLDPGQFKKVGKNWVHKETGAVYSKSHTSHGNVGNTGSQWKAWPKGTKDFGSTSKSTGTRVTIDGQGNVVGN